MSRGCALRQVRMDARRAAQRMARSIRKPINEADAAPGTTREHVVPPGQRPEGRAISGRFVVARFLNPVPEGATPGRVPDPAADSTPGDPIHGDRIYIIDLEIDPSRTPAHCSEAPLGTDRG